MEQRRDEFLAGPGLALDDDVHISRGHPLNQGKEPAHRRAPSDHVAEPDIGIRSHGLHGCAFEMADGGRDTFLHRQPLEHTAACVAFDICMP